MNLSEQTEPTERLAAILAADAVGFSRLMHANERVTLATLDEFRDVFRQRIEHHHGRIVDMAGDSILAIFDSATGAVNAATEAQHELTQRNEALPETQRMRFRVGVNLGDILLKDDGTIYGDGVNVAARLQSMARPGGINVAGSVFDSVRAKVAGPFTFLGEHTLKNISSPVPVYAVGNAPAAANTEPSANTHQAAGKSRPTVVVMPLQIISGGDEISSLAGGLYQDILGSLTKQSALDVIGGERREGEAATSHTAGEFQLEGSIRAAGDRLRLSFTLFDTGGRRQLWSERYDRQLSDVFALEDEISRNVASTVRLRIKTGAFEKLRNTPNAQLAVPELLSKAAGMIVESYAHNDEVSEILRVALNLAPDHSMANAMAVFSRYRTFEFSAFALSDEINAQLLAQSHRALALENASYFAHLMAALIHQDLYGDFAAALVHAETALSLNSSFSQALAMVGIVKIHLGEIDEGLRQLQSGLDAAPEDPHRFRHLRELGLGYLAAGDPARAATAIDKLIHQAPDLLRNELLAAPVLWHAGRHTDAAQRITKLLAHQPGLNLRNMRQVHVGNPALASLLIDGLTAAGMPA